PEVEQAARRELRIAVVPSPWRWLDDCPIHQDMSPSRAIVIILAASVIVAQEAPSTVAAAGVDVVTYHNDPARTGQHLNETLLTPSRVNVATFGRVGFLPTDGKVDAQPLYLSAVPVAGQGTHNVVY